MRTRRALCLLISIGVTTIAVPSISSARITVANREMPSLGHTNVILGRHSAALTVRLHDAATINFSGRDLAKNGPNESISIRGSGRFVGFSITPAYYPANWPDQSLVVGRFADCPRKACPRGNRPFQYGNGPTNFSPGIYRVYLITDGSNVRIRFNLDGPTGRTVIRPRTRVFTDIKSPRPHFVAEAKDPYAYLGATYRMVNPGFRLSLLRIETELSLGATVGSCSYRGELSESPMTAYSPACTGNDYNESEPDVFPPFPQPPGRYTYLLSERDQGVPRGEWSQGFYALTSGHIKSVSAPSVFVSYLP